MIPIGVGDSAAQDRFLKRYRPFLNEYPELSGLLKKVFLRALKNPSDEEFKKIEGLPDTDPAVTTFDDRVTADRVIFYLGRIAVDDFGELLVLSGNGKGIGAYKILRGMYERIVHAAFIAKNPPEAPLLAEQEAIDKWKL